MAIIEDLDPDVLLKIDLMIIIFSPEVIFFEGTIFFDESTLSVLNERCEGNSNDEEVLERCVSFLTGKISFSEGFSWRGSEDEVEKLATLLIGGKIFSTKGALWNILLSLKDEWECALDASADAIKSDATNESLVLFSFLSDFLAFADDEVLRISDEGWVSKVSSSLVPFYDSQLHDLSWMKN